VGDIIEHGENGGPQVIRVGESGSQLSIKVYQDVYHQVTGRTEKIRKRYSNNILVDFSEIEQLHHKIMQLCDVHNIVARNEIISVFHNKERKEQFTSFERFAKYNANATSPCVNLVLQYNFSIIPAGLDRPQEYVVSIRLTSRVAMLQEIESDAPPFMRGRVFGYIASNTAEVSVEYADYVIARGFLEAFDEWIDGCKSEPDIKWLSFLQRWSHLCPPALRFAAALSIIIGALEAAGTIFSTTQSPLMVARFFIIFSGAFYLITSLASAVGRVIEDSIDNFFVISYLKLNKGDSNLVDDFKTRKRKVVLKFIFGCLMTVALRVISSKISSLI